MTLQLPPPIAGYFAADRSRDPAAVAACFTADAVVADERRRHRGREAIRRWKEEASTTYEYAVEPFAIEPGAGRIVVAGHVTGTFPGSPVDLRYGFVLDGAEIAELEITR